MSFIAYKYRIYPNEEQSIKIKKTVGCARLTYNLLLEDYKVQLDNHNETDYPVKLKEVSYFKQQPEYNFLNEVDSLALANSKMNIQSALKNFFDSRKGKRKGKKVCFPKKHKKSKSRLTYTTNNQNGTVDIKDGHIKLPKIGWIKMVEHRPHEGVIKSVTVTQERDDTFYVSVRCEIPDKEYNLSYLNKPKNEIKVVGLDMSFDKFIVDSDDTVSDDMKTKYVRQYRTHERKLKRLSRSLSRKQEKGNNREKARVKLAKEHRKVTNCRLDFAHKTSSYYAKNYDVIVIEDIDMSSMAKSKLRGHGKSANDLGFGMFKTFLKYKCPKNGSLLIHADRWYPSSKLCSVCGTKNTNLELKDREWTCPHCGTVHNRDKNAAYNLRDWFYTEYCNNTAGTAEIYAYGDATSTPGSPDPLASSIDMKEVGSC